MEEVDGRLALLIVDPAGGSDLRGVLARCGFDVTSSTTPEAALFEFAQRDYEAVVLVLPLPGLGGVGLCEELRARGRTPVLVVTSDPTTNWLDVLRAGADDHVRMPCDERELRARLHALVRRFRGQLSPTRVVEIGNLTVRLGREGTVKAEPTMALTGVQTTLLGHLAGHPGVVLSTTALADRVRAVNGPLSEAQLDSELAALNSLVAVASGISDIVQHVAGTGWRLATEPN